MAIPTDIANLGLWLDADDASSFTLTGTDVDQWNDKSGNSRHVVQATPANKPSRLVFDGRYGLFFNGTSDQLTSSTTYSFTEAVTGKWTSFAVFRPNIVSGVRSILDMDNETARLAQNIRANGTIIDGLAFNTGGTAYTDTYPSAGIAIGYTYIASVVRGATTIETFLNGASNGTTATAGTVATTASAVRVGAHQGGSPSQFFSGYILEVIHYNAELSSGDRAAIELYLRNKWVFDAQHEPAPPVRLPPRVLGMGVPNQMLRPVSLIEDVTAGQSHPISYKTPQPNITVNGITQTSDYPFHIIESQPNLGTAVLAHSYPTPITIADRELCLLVVWGGSAVSGNQAISISSTSGVVWEVMGRSQEAAGTAGTGAFQYFPAAVDIGSTGGDNANGRFGGTYVFWYYNNTGSTITTTVTANFSINLNNPSNPRMGNIGMIFPITFSGARPPGDGLNILTQAQNGTGLSAGWGHYSPRGGTWLWAMVRSMSTAGWPIEANPTGSINVETYAAYNPGGGNGGFGWSLLRGTVPTSYKRAAQGGAVLLPAVSSIQSHYWVLEIAPEIGWEEASLQKVNPGFVPGQFVKTGSQPPVSITGPKYVQPKGFDSFRGAMQAGSTASTTEGLQLSPFSPGAPQTFNSFKQTSGTTDRVLNMEPILIGPGETALLFMQVECLSSLNITTYTSSHITSVVEGPGSNSSIQPTPISWQLVRNGAGTRAFKSHSTGSSQFGGLLAVYFAYNPPSNGWVISCPQITTNSEISPYPASASNRTSYLAAEIMPVIFRNAYPNLAGGNFGIYTTGGSAAVNGNLITVGGSSWIWGLSGSKDLGTNVNSSASNCDYHYAGTSTSGAINARGFNVFRSTKLNQGGTTVSPAIAYTSFNNSGGDAIWLEIRQEEKAKPKRLVYPGNGPGAAPGGRLQAFIPGEEVQNALNIYVRQSGGNVQAIALKVRQSGVWVDAVAIKSRQGGSWIIA